MKLTKEIIEASRSKPGQFVTLVEAELDAMELEMRVEWASETYGDAIEKQQPGVTDDE